MKTSSFVLGGLAGAAVIGFMGWRRRRTPSNEVHASSLTALAAESLRTGVAIGVLPPREPAIPGEDEMLQVGDPDVDALENAYGGEETPGGDNPTPDQDRVDDIGRAYGVNEVDSGELVTSGEILARRDRRRSS
jgi:hypothetical protein